jgi:RNA polymerase sigma factor (sigma-70 family)
MAVTESGLLASREIDDLYRAHGAEVYRYAFAVLGNHADAEDVTQTTFLNAYRSLEQGVRPRKPSNWLLTIASNAIKQRFRLEQSRPRQVELDERIAGTDFDDDDGPTVGELLTALSKIPPQQRQAIVLREFEGRSYNEIAGILNVTTSALETLLFRARRSLAEELQSQLSCTEAQLAISQSVDGRLGRKERRRLRDHLGECPDCARFARMQRQNRSALRGLALVPIPLSLSLFKGFEGTASASVIPISAGSAAAGGAVAAGAGIGSGASAAGSGGLLAGGIGLKAAAVVAAASVAGGVGVAGSSEVDSKPQKSKPGPVEQRGERLGQVAPRGVLVPGNGIAVGKANAPGQTKAKTPGNGKPQGAGQADGGNGKSEVAKANAPGQADKTTKPATGKGSNGKGNANGKATSATATAKPKTNTGKGAEEQQQQQENAAKPNPGKANPATTTEPSASEPVEDPAGGNGNGSANGNANTGGSGNGNGSSKKP